MSSKSVLVRKIDELSERKKQWRQSAGAHGVPRSELVDLFWGPRLSHPAKKAPHKRCFLNSILPHLSDELCTAKDMEMEVGDGLAGVGAAV